MVKIILLLEKCKDYFQPAPRWGVVSLEVFVLIQTQYKSGVGTYRVHGSDPESGHHQEL